MERLKFDTDVHNPMELSNHVARYLPAAPYVKGKTVLDIACGEGWGSYLMAKQWGAAFVHAVDRSPSAIEKARNRFQLPNVKWSVMDAEHLDPGDFENAFDVVISIETLEHLNAPEAFLKALSRLGKPGGMFLISCPNDQWFYGPGGSKNPYHVRTYSFQDFKAMTESVLGPAAHYLLGTKNTGFAAVPSADKEASSRDMLDALDKLQPIEGIRIPISPELALDPAHALYFIGVWGRVHPAPVFTVSGIHPEKRFPLDHLRPLGMDVAGPKKKITLVADTPGWAYDNISRNIRKHLGDTFDIRIVHVVDYKDFDTAFLDLFCLNETDYIHFFWREYLFAMFQEISPKTIASRFPFDGAMDRFCEKIITLSIYDHLYLSETEIRDRQSLFAVTDAYSVCSRRLFETYARHFHIPPDVIIEDGVDPDLFPPRNLERFQETGRALVVGWAGNSRWHFNDKEDPKGLHTILKPAIQRLQEQGIDVQGRYADVSEKIRPRSQMPDFYNSLDVLVCASAIEGTPNPVLEAMACGVPIVSTDVGIVPDVFGPRQRNYILFERTVEAMAQRLAHLARNRMILSELSKENLDRIRHWTWAHHMTKWMLLFKTASFRHDTRAMHRKRRFLKSYLMSKPVPKGSRLKAYCKKAAYRVHPDTLFWRNVKNRAMKPWRRIRNGRSND